ncbi:MAG: GHKL domain-containing protein [Pseudomonadales bacterium]|nr:GHKL domain-containing protein [Pseudomonadales bacterium]
MQLIPSQMGIQNTVPQKMHNDSEIVQQLNALLKNEIDNRVTLTRRLTKMQAMTDATVNSVPWIVVWISADCRYIEVNNFFSCLLNNHAEALVGEKMGQTAIEKTLTAFIHDFFKRPQSLTETFELSFIQDDEPQYYIITAHKYDDQHALSLVGQNINTQKHYQHGLEKLNHRLDSQVQTRTNELSANDEKLKQTQSQLMQSEKLASIGTMAAGIAHELNNPIGFIQSNLNLLNDYFEKLQPILALIRSDQWTAEQLSHVKNSIQDLNWEYLLPDIEAILHESCVGTERVTEIVNNMKNFSRSEDGTQKTCVAKSCIRDTLKLCHNDIKYHCHVRQKITAKRDIQCPPGELNQILLNLLTNAAHAIQAEGEISIHAFERNGFCYIEIRDNGHGIPSDKIDCIFDPFFTTKPVGEGTGLGLFVSHGIVQKHGGELSVKSQPGKGSCFTLSLPLAN